ncbi:MAG: response regulator transcription factor [Kiritimatiellia bacterium]
MDVLIADDERVVREGLRELLAGEGFSVRTARDGREALAKFDERCPDLVVLDVMMPKMNGFLACEEIRRRNRAVPVVFLTAKDAEADQVRGLGLGADDYIAKDASEAVLLARIRRAVERTSEGTRSAEALPPSPNVIRIGATTVDVRAYAVSDANGFRAWLTKTEVGLLKALWEAEGTPVGVEKLIEVLRGDGFACEDAMLYTHVCRLRRKLGADGRRIVCRHGAGYKLVCP